MRMDIKLFLDMHNRLLMVVVDKSLIRTILPTVFTGRMLCLQVQNGLRLSMAIPKDIDSPFKGTTMWTINIKTDKLVFESNMGKIIIKF